LPLDLLVCDCRCALVSKHTMMGKILKPPIRCSWCQNSGITDRQVVAAIARPFESRLFYSSQSVKPSSPQPIIFSGIQPTGVPHLGNYLGALREWVRLQGSASEESKLIFSIVDLHALTVPQESTHLRQWRKQAFAMLLAIGLDPNRVTIFYQSAVGN
jgi:tryptophanyl-tRNA synthetase